MPRGPLLALMLLAPPAAAADPAPPAGPARALEQQTRRVIEAAERSVVAVVVSHRDYPPRPAADKAPPGTLGGYAPPRPDPLAAPDTAPPAAARLDLSDPANAADNLLGSGVVLDAARGLVLTTHHLIDGATKVYVRGPDGKGSYADIHAADARSDLAVLRLIDPVRGLKAAKPADVRVGDGPPGERPTVTRGTWVVALGHPAGGDLGDAKPAAGWGVVSAVRRRTPGPGRDDQRSRALHHYGTLLQTDVRTAAASGGGLFNLDGELVALTTPLAAAAGADTAGGFAVPLDRTYRRILDVLRQGREVEYGFLGVSVAADGFRLPPAPRPGVGGVRIGSVTPGTPAADAGLVGNDRFAADGDTLVAVDGQPLRDADDLFLHVGTALAGSPVRLTVARGGRTREVDVALAKYLNPLPWVASRPADDLFGLRVEHASVLVQPTGGGAVPPGVAVRDVVPASPAAAALAALPDPPPRWVVARVDGRRVSSPAEFHAACAGKRAVRLTLLDPADPDRRPEITLP